MNFINKENTLHVDMIYIPYVNNNSVKMPLLQEVCSKVFL